MSVIFCHCEHVTADYFNTPGTGSCTVRPTSLAMPRHAPPDPPLTPPTEALLQAECTTTAAEIKQQQLVQQMSDTCGRETQDHVLATRKQTKNRTDSSEQVISGTSWSWTEILTGTF